MAMSTTNWDEEPMRYPTVDVILPCLNEAAALPGVLARISAMRGFRPVLVDNGSTDGSPQVAEREGATVLREPRPGYGAAVHTGLEHATADFVAMVDADGSMDPQELTELLRPVVREEAHLAVGRRVPVRSGVWPWHARAGNAVLASRLRRRGAPVHDLAPVRVARRTDLLSLHIQDRAFGYPLELLLRATRAGWHVLEVPVSYYPRTDGTTSKVTGSVRGTARAVRDMIGVMR